ncbi:winged helix DNA-binding protein [Pseudooceanicola sp. GBMRC 2024]|uniref:Winged helix DNA-binding protein n=1 Tax=Pseudooceanicola albus TaxID=2692189 RepID=A0A6L7G377_9RHOB|nr:MarR family transcriptional regulator [Pseudooceanicola albus]MXN17927.1 winged helix DNA-binding protein [Pseudooceanicola albus]
MTDETAYQPDPWDDLGRILPAVGQAWRRSLGQALSAEGLSDATALPILVLWRAKDRAIRQHELAQLLGLETSGVVRLLDTLGRRGLLNRIPDPADRRARLLELTDEGRALGARADRIARALRRALLADLPEADLQATYRVLLHLSDVLDTREQEQKAK